jgi:hypothetical protein
MESYPFELVERLRGLIRTTSACELPTSEFIPDGYPRD